MKNLLGALLVCVFDTSADVDLAGCALWLEWSRCWVPEGPGWGAWPAGRVLEPPPAGLTSCHARWRRHCSQLCSAARSWSCVCEYHQLSLLVVTDVSVSCVKHQSLDHRDGQTDVWSCCSKPVIFLPSNKIWLRPDCVSDCDLVMFSFYRAMHFSRCTLVQSAVLRSHVVCLSVCLSVCL